jgi:RNA polymerase sigma factor (sigma-70 family)
MPRLVPLPRLRPSAPDTDRALVARFAATSDPAAFAELVRRHGPLVLGVCRRAARDPDLADDAFQATFLVLARKAGHLRNPDALPSWLFGVARKVAAAARRREDRQAQLLRRAAADTAPTGSPPAWDDLLVVLDEELARLPDRYRAPLLACYLDGRTQDEAARQLGWSVSTLRRRLEAARTRLRVRLTARGATLGGGLVAGVVVPATAAVPGPLARAVVESAAGGVAPARVLALAGGGVSVAKWAVSAAVLLVTGGLAIGLGTGGAGPRPQLPSPGPLTPRFVAAPVPADAHEREFEALWADLAKDEPAASRALLKLSAKPKEAVAFLGKKAKPLTITPARVKQLIADLGSDKAEVWKAAFEEFEYYDPRLAVNLEKLMEQVTDNPARQRLVAVLGDSDPEDPEIRKRDTIQLVRVDEKHCIFSNEAGTTWWAEHRVDRLNAVTTPKRQWTRAVRAVALLEHIGTPVAVAVLRDVATGHPDAQPTRAAKQALQRLAGAK